MNAVDADAVPGVFVRVPPGRCIDRFEVLDPIGAGSWGTVYAARCLGPPDGGAASAATACGLRSGDDVALKFLPARRLTPGRRGVLDEVIRREIAVAGRWDHPNLLTTHTCLTVRDADDPDIDGALVVVMERAHAGLCERWAACASGTPMPDGAAILAGVAAGLARLHAEGWVHGDLKPGNILLAADGTAKIADFGLATEMDGTHGYLPHLGTTDYLPPEWWTERATPGGVAIRPTADVWAFGITAHQVLTGGLHPFPGMSSRARTAAAAAYARGAEPLRLADGLPGCWRSIIADCLAPTHAARAAIPAQTLLARIRAAGPATPSPSLGLAPPNARAAGSPSAPDTSAAAPPPQPRSVSTGPTESAPPPSAPTDTQATTAAPTARTTGRSPSDQPTTPAPPARRRPSRRAVWLAPLPALLTVPLLVGAAGSGAPPPGASGGQLRAGAAVPAPYRQMIVQAADTFPNHAITPSLVAAIVATESGFNPDAEHLGVDGTPEYGIAGWTPRVFADFAVDASGDGHPDYRNPRDAIFSLVRQLAWDDDNLGDVPGDRALLLAAAYHTSIKYVRTTDGRGPACADYVARIRHYLTVFTDPAHGTVPGQP